MTLKHAALAAALLIGGSAIAVAQNTPPNPTNPDNPRPTYTPSAQNPRDTKVTNRDAGDGMLKPGANSFTEDQARRRIEDNGYTGIVQLHKDQNSIWQAQAMKDGRPVRVGLDYRGNIVEVK